MKESKKYVDLVWEVLNNWWVKFAELTPSLVVGILVFCFFLYFSKFLSRVSVRLFQKVLRKYRNHDTIINLIGFFMIIIILIGTFISLEIVGLSGFFIKFIGSLGVAGIIAGVALKDIVSSMFSGMLVNIDNAFKVGDTVQIGNITGKVVEIGFLTTKLFTDDGRKYYIPNQQIFNSPFINFSESQDRKVIIDFEVPNTVNLNQLQDIILDELKTAAYVSRPEVAKVVFTNQKMGAYDFQVHFVMSSDTNVTDAKSQAIFNIKQRLDAAQIDTSVPPTVIN
ncbi:mechanosensitive ion channel protein MscS [Bergeyella porcorum]|uniref:Mechanosensitive ion channel protein MscS n=1 Tax=Bergeyella porcorum TaxID=1735111 RepID=A0AAU0F8B9_9FLAO